MEENRFDKLFQDKLSDFEVPYEPAEWDLFEEKLDASNRKKPFGWALGALLLVGSFSLVTYLTTTGNSSDEQLATVEQRINTSTGTPSTALSAVNSSADKKANTKTAGSFISTSKNNNNPFIKSNTTSLGLKQIKTTALYDLNKSLQFRNSPIATNTAFTNNNRNNNSLLGEINNAILTPDTNNRNSNANISAPVVNTENNSVTNNNSSIQKATTAFELDLLNNNYLASIDSVFHHKIPNGTADIDNPNLERRKTNPIPISSAHYKTKSFVQFYAGVEANKLQDGYSDDLFLGYKAGINYQYEVAHWLALETGLGANFKTFKNSNFDNYVNEGTPASDVVKSADSWFLEIPLNAQILLYRGPINAYLTTGASMHTHFFTNYKFGEGDNSSTTFQGYGTTNDFETSKLSQLSNFSWSSNQYFTYNLGFGLRGELNRSWSWYAEPKIQIPLSTLGGTNEIKSFGIIGGLRHRF